MPRAELLTPLELDFLWDSYGTGELPYPLDLRSHGGTLDERAMLRRQSMDRLAQRGLVDDRGRLAAHLEDWFEMLAMAEASLDTVQLTEAGSAPLLAVAAARGTHGVLAVQDTRGTHLHPVAGDGLTSAIVSLLPTVARGSEKSITVPLEQLLSGSGVDFLQRRAASHESQDRAPGGDGHGDGRASADADRKALARLHAQARLRGGQVGANARSRVGVRSRSSVLSWFDTETGRYFTQASRGRDGSDWITIAPADAATLRHRLSEMLASAVDSSAVTL